MDRRRFPRKDVNVKGLLSSLDGLSCHVCQLVNLSFGGALLRVLDPAAIPDCANLYFDSPEQELAVGVARAIS